MATASLVAITARRMPPLRWWVIRRAVSWRQSLRKAVEEIQFTRWNEFRSYIDEDRQILPVYWRGQKDPSWVLASRFERLILDFCGGWKKGASKVYPYDGRYLLDGKPVWEEGLYRSMRDRYLEVFKRAASGLRGANPANLDTDQWWALGRHYGLVTPLLDWTESPYIAAFFALAEFHAELQSRGGGLKFEGQEVAVYRLFHNEKLEGDCLRVVRPAVDELGRMQGQRGLFTWLDSERYFELQGFLDDMGKGNLLTRIRISDQALHDGLRDLKAHGIDYRLLYPDLEGAALYANSRWDIF